MLIYDLEIKKAILGKNELPITGITYCEGWTDYIGMGISIVCAYETDTQQMFSLLDNQLDEFISLVDKTDYCIGFNNHNFDNKLLAAFGYDIPVSKSYDIYEEIIKAAGGSFRKGYKLDQVAIANGITGKLEGISGALAPVMYQRGQHDELHAYCRNDVDMTRAILEAIIARILVCPVTGGYLDVTSPADRLGVKVQRGLF